MFTSSNFFRNLSGNLNRLPQDRKRRKFFDDLKLSLYSQIHRHLLLLLDLLKMILIFPVEESRSSFVDCLKE
jgi:hypothetical protein